MTGAHQDNISGLLINAHLKDLHMKEGEREGESGEKSLLVLGAQMKDMES